MKKVYSDKQYDYYRGIDAVRYVSASVIYNIVPKGTKNIDGGYKSKEYIEKIKKTKFPSDNEIWEYYLKTLGGIEQ